MNSLLNRRTAPQIVRLCALCFKHGVLDAYEMGDNYAARQFVERHKAGWTYGMLKDPEDYDWKMWRFSLYKWCRFGGLSQFAETYLYEVKKYNYLFCPILLSMRFYLMGIEEWLEYPNPVGIERFKLDGSVHWKPVPPGARKITRKEIITEMQDVAYQYRRLPEESLTVSATVLNEFSSAIYDMTSKYAYKKRIIIDGTTVKNV